MATRINLRRSTAVDRVDTTQPDMRTRAEALQSSKDGTSIQAQLVRSDNGVSHLYRSWLFSMLKLSFWLQMTFATEEIVHIKRSSSDVYNRLDSQTYLGSDVSRSRTSLRDAAIPV